MKTHLTPGQRLLHLDALRAAAMLFGIMVHGATIGLNGNLYPVIGASSDLFRMATFFLLSGFFTAMVYDRAKAGEYVPNRMRLILLPLAVMLVLFMPLTNWLIWRWHNTPVTFAEYLQWAWRVPSRGNNVWYLHLWFLFTLFAFAMAAPWLLRLARSRPVAGAMDRLAGGSGARLLWAGALVGGLAFVAARSLNDQLVEPLIPSPSVDFIVRSTMHYLVFFAFGVAAYAHAGFYRAMHRVDWLGLALFGAALWAVTTFGGALPHPLERAAYFLARGALTLFVIAALIRVCERLITRPYAWLAFLVGAAYTFYLFHMTVIYVLANLLGPLVPDLHVLFWIIVAVGAPLALALHRFVIAPSPLLTLVFNGKKAKPAARPQAAA